MLSIPEEWRQIQISLPRQRFLVEDWKLILNWKELRTMIWTKSQTVYLSNLWVTLSKLEQLVC